MSGSWHAQAIWHGPDQRPLQHMMHVACLPVAYDLPEVTSGQPELRSPVLVHTIVQAARMWPVQPVRITVWLSLTHVDTSSELILCPPSCQQQILPS
jgi:hypothetical protein